MIYLQLFNYFKYLRFLDTHFEVFFKGLFERTENTILSKNQIYLRLLKVGMSVSQFTSHF